MDVVGTISFYEGGGVVPENLKERVDYATWAIRSFTAGIITVLLALVVWLATSKDSSVLASIKDLGEQQKIWQVETRTSDQKILESLNRICDRLSIVEGRVNTHDIFFQMPFGQRQKFFDTSKPNGRKEIGTR